MKKILLLMIGAVSVLTSCKDTPNQPSSITDYNPEELTQTLYADQTSTPTAFSFTAASHWDAVITPATRADEENWLAIFPESGEAGPANMKIVLSANLTGEMRSADIKIVCGSSIIVLRLDQSGLAADDSPLQTNIVASYALYEKPISHDYYGEKYTTSYFTYGRLNTIAEIETSNISDGSSQAKTNSYGFSYSPSSVSYFTVETNQPDSELPKTANINSRGLIETYSRMNVDQPFRGGVSQPQATSALFPTEDFVNTYNELGQLIKAEVTSNTPQGLNSKVEEPETHTYHLKWENDNCMEVVFVDNAQDTLFITTFEYSEYLNTLNIDPMIFNNMTPLPVTETFFAAMGLNGLRSENLISKINYHRVLNSDLGFNVVQTPDYVFSESNLLTQIKIRHEGNAVDAEGMPAEGSPAQVDSIYINITY